MGLWGNIGQGFLGFGSLTPNYGSSFVGPLPNYAGAVGNAANTVGNLNLGNNGGLLSNLFGNNGGGIMGGLSQLGGLATGLMQAYSGFQQLGLANKALNLAKQQFGFQKALANRNLANQAKIINNTYDNAAQVAAGMIGGKDANGNYGFTDPTLVNQYANRAKSQHVNGSAI